ncbi:hypothetical protein GW17_00058210, partial [Ensete ventricosum]
FNAELAETFAEWNRDELASFLIEITADIFGGRDDHGEGELVDKILDKTGMKGTGKWTVHGQPSSRLLRRPWRPPLTAATFVGSKRRGRLRLPPESVLCFFVICILNIVLERPLKS